MESKEKKRGTGAKAAKERAQAAAGETTARRETAAGRRRRTLRQELLERLRQPEVQSRMSEALVREATEGNRSGSVIRALEMVRQIVGEQELDGGGDTDLSRFSDEQLREMIAAGQEDTDA